MIMIKRKIYAGNDTTGVSAGMLGYAGNTLAEVKELFAGHDYGSAERMSRLVMVLTESEERRFYCRPYETFSTTADDALMSIEYAYFMPIVSKENAENFLVFQNGNKVAWSVSCKNDGYVDWLNEKVELVELPKTKHVPFANFAELCEAAKEHNAHYNIFGFEKSVWLKEKRSGNRYLVIGVGGALLTAVYLGRKHYTLEQLLNTHTFLDDTPCGKQVLS
ncbi:MAG: hypothetical protein K2I95_10430 [Treponemataceae bacterium]|nr:hypothetical protein [Treponemataceae bacterium]